MRFTAALFAAVMVASAAGSPIVKQANESTGAVTNGDDYEQSHIYTRSPGDDYKHQDSMYGKRGDYDAQSSFYSKRDEAKPESDDYEQEHIYYAKRNDGDDYEHRDSIYSKRGEAKQEGDDYEKSNIYTRSPSDDYKHQNSMYGKRGEAKTEGDYDAQSSIYSKRDGAKAIWVAIKFWVQRWDDLILAFWHLSSSWMHGVLHAVEASPIWWPRTPLSTSSPVWDLGCILEQKMYVSLNLAYNISIWSVENLGYLSSMKTHEEWTTYLVINIEVWKL